MATIIDVVLLLISQKQPAWTLCLTHMIFSDISYTDKQNFWMQFSDFIIKILPLQSLEQWNDNVHH